MDAPFEDLKFLVVTYLVSRIPRLLDATHRNPQWNVVM